LAAASSIIICIESKHAWGSARRPRAGDARLLLLSGLLCAYRSL
jgi:hypothetical protein